MNRTKLKVNFVFEKRFSEKRKKRPLWFYDRTIKPIEFDLVAVLCFRKFNILELHPNTNTNIFMRSMLVRLQFSLTIIQIYF